LDQQSVQRKRDSCELRKRGTTKYYPKKKNTPQRETPVSKLLEQATDTERLTK